MRAIVIISLATLAVPSLATAVEQIATPAARTQTVAQPTARQGAPATVPDAQDDSQTERRCAYLGHWGSFHLLRNGGTAAYRMKSGQYFAELVHYYEDPNWWVYRQVPHKVTTNNKVTEWAFATRPDSCGRYQVLQKSGGMWRPYETAYGWGQRFGISKPVYETVPGPGPGFSVVDGQETSVTIVNATGRDLPDLFVAFVDANELPHKSDPYSIPKNAKQDIGGMTNSPKRLRNSNLAVGVFSKDGSIALGKGNGIPLSELVYHHCSDGKVAIGIVLH